MDFGTPTHEMRGGVGAHFKSMHDQKGLNSSCTEKTNKEAAQLKAPGLNRQQLVMQTHELSV